MSEIRGYIYEEIGIKAFKRGFFKEWQELTSSFKDSEEIPLHEAAEKAYKQLKLQGSE